MRKIYQDKVPRKRRKEKIKRKRRKIKRRENKNKKVGENTPIKNSPTTVAVETNNIETQAKAKAYNLRQQSTRQTVPKSAFIEKSNRFLLKVISQKNKKKRNRRNSQ